MPADVELRIDASNRGALSALRSTKSELGSVGRQAKETGAGLRVAERDLSRTTRGALAGSGAFRHLGRSIAFASGAFLGAAGFASAVRTSLREAIDLNSQIARSTVVFGEHAKGVQEWSRTTEKSISLAAETSLKAANDFGTMLTAMGLAPGRAAELAREMTKVAAAVSLARGEADPSNAVRAISVALSGRGRALRQYGIVLDEANIKAEALREGLVGTSRDTTKVTIAQNALNIASARYADELKRHGRNSTQAASAYNAMLSAQVRLRKETAGHAITLTNAQKAQAASNLVLRAGQRYTDQYGKLLNTTAGRQRRFNEGVQNLREELGTAMLPAFNRLLDAVNRYLGSLAEGGSRHRQFIRVEQQVASATRAVWHALEGAAGAAKLIVSATGGWKTAFELVLGGVLVAKLLKIVGALKSARIWTLAWGAAAPKTAAEVVAASATEEAAIAGVAAESTALMTLWAVALPAAFALAAALVIANSSRIKRALGDLYAQSETPLGRAGGVQARQGRVYIPGRGMVSTTSAAGGRYLGRHPQARVYTRPPRGGGDLARAIGIAQQVREEARARGATSNAEQEQAVDQALAAEGFDGHTRHQAIIQTRPRATYGGLPAPASPAATGRRGGSTSAAAGGVTHTAYAASQRPGHTGVGFHLPGERSPYDCSAFTQAVFAQNGIHIGSTTYTQQNNGVPVAKADVQPGDLLFFTYPGERRPGHVGIYMGGGMMVHDHGASSGVSYQPVDWGHFNFARRVAGSGQRKGANLGGSGGDPAAQTGAGTGLHVDHPAKKKKKPPKPHFADPETIRIEDRRIRDEEAAVRRARRRGEITPQQATQDLKKLEALRKQLHAGHLKPAEERDIQDRVSRLWRGINKTIQAGVARARKHTAELAKAHAKAVSDAEKVVEGAREKLGRAWDTLTSRADEAFDRLTQKGVDAISKRYDAPTAAEAALAALQQRGSDLTNARALSDANDQMSLAQRLGDPQMIKEAQRAVEDAQLAAQEEGLQKQADAERTAAEDRKQQEIQDYEDMREIQKQKMDDFLVDLKAKLDAGTVTWADALDEVKGLLQDPGNLGDFAALGGLIGDTFTQGLIDALAGTHGAAAAVDGALTALKKLGYRWNPDTGDWEKLPPVGAQVGTSPLTGGSTGAHIGGRRTPAAARGAIVTRPQLVAVGEQFKPEGIFPLEDLHKFIGDSSGGTAVVVNVGGSVIAERDLAQVVRSELLRIQKRNGGSLGFSGR